MLKGDWLGVVGVAWSPDGKRLASSSEDGWVKVWDVRTRHVVLSLERDRDRVWGVAWSPDGRRLASTLDKTVKVWDARTGQLALELQGHTGSVTGVAWSPDCSRLATASHDKTVKV
jgi:WD40 repeat protein